MDATLYRKYLETYIREAIQNSSGTNDAIAHYLSEIHVKGLVVQHRAEKTRALADACAAFSEHRHWPRQIILSHLGIEIDAAGS